MHDYLYMIFVIFFCEFIPLHYLGWVSVFKIHNYSSSDLNGVKSWDEVLENDRKKLGLDSADPQNRSEWRGRLRERLVKKPNPR